MPVEAPAVATRLSPDSHAISLAAAKSREKVYAPLKILTVVQVLSECGISPEAALAGTGLRIDEVRDPGVRTSVQQLLAVGRNAVRLCPLPELGLNVGRRLHVTSYGLYGYALLCAETMRQGFDLSMRYHGLATPVMPVAFSESDAEGILHLPTHGDVGHLGLSPPEYGFFLDMQFALHATLGKDVMGAWCVPAKAYYALPRPAHAEQIERALECAVVFGHACNELRYPREWLDRAPHMANPITAAQMSQSCERLLQESAWQSGLTRRVYEAITQVPGRFPGIEQVASSLCMTSRTLSRKLAAEGTTYSDLLARLRHALALDYLRTTRLSMDDIAEALGFSDANSFRQAFRRWSGKSPTEYRP
ncbi:AraC family transcriptional regulator [Dokdonella sp.]|uniref:AraC family transcriptional regulator n=1 Tax=Dokdonella sp. TaxID=2291710 RepID=UPI002F415953